MVNFIATTIPLLSLFADLHPCVLPCVWTCCNAALRCCCYTPVSWFTPCLWPCCPAALLPCCTAALLPCVASALHPRLCCPACEPATLLPLRCCSELSWNWKNKNLKTHIMVIVIVKPYQNYSLHCIALHCISSHFHHIADNEHIVANLMPHTVNMLWPMHWSPLLVAKLYDSASVA